MIFKWVGKWNIKIIRKDKVLKKIVIFNQITNLAKDEMIKCFDGDYVNLTIKELAIGTGTTSPSASDTKLETEIYRVTYNESTRSGIGTRLSTFTLNGSEYAGHISELGVFAGHEAQTWSGGIGKDTGLLMSRVICDIDLESDQEIYFQRTDAIT